MDDAERLDHIQKQMITIPKKPGVYVIRNEDEEVIYVGKANNLVSRLRSHFAKSTDFSKSRVIREKGADIEVHVVNSENEALLLEYSFIQEYEPKLNERWRDGKTYPFLEVTTGETFPRFRVVRDKDNKDSVYLGPFSNVGSLKRSLKYIFTLFPVADCGKEINLGDAQGWASTCIRRRTNQCLKPCEVVVDPDEYRHQVSQVVDFIEGRLPDIAADLEKNMKSEAKKEKFESAANFRDHLRAVNRTLQRQQVMMEGVSDCYVLSFSSNTLDSCVCLSKITDGRIARQETSLITNDELKMSDNRSLWSDFVINFLIAILRLNMEIDLSISQFIVDIRQPKTIMKMLKEFGFKTKGPENEIEIQLVRMNKLHAKRILQQKLLLNQDSNIPTTRVEDLREMLQMDTVPIIIDTFDVSTLLGKNNVASCVRFMNAVPYKKGYRRFKINTVHQQDDFASMEEVVFRRYRTVKNGVDNKNLPQPNLIVVDGGSEQLKRAKISLDKIGLDIPVIGLAKREEEIYQTEIKQPLKFDRDRPGLLLIRAGRDEAHRFAVTYQRKVRQKEGLQSILDSINGIGPKRKKQLLTQYRTVRNIAKESSETLSANLKISKKLASQIIDTSRGFVTSQSDRVNRRRPRKKIESVFNTKNDNLEHKE